MHRSIFLSAVLLLVPAASRAISPKVIYQKDSPAVVLLLCVGEDGNGELGSGSVIDDKGHILTNAHVVLRASTGKPYEKIKVYFKPAKVSGDPAVDLTSPKLAHVAASDRALDLALLELEEKPAELTVLALGDSSAVDTGEPVVAIGHPEQGGLWTLTQGVVSTVVAGLGGVKGKDVFQTDASINRGNSGGPLINKDGALIGVNTSMARKAADGLTITSVNFSLKSSVVKDWLAKSGAGVSYSEMAPAADKPAEEAPPAAKTEAPPAAKTEAPPAAKTEAPPAAKTEAPPAAKTEAPPAAKTEAPPAAKTEAQAPEKPSEKPAAVTPAKPYKIDDVIAREMAEMEDMGKEMQGEIEKRRALLNP